MSGNDCWKALPHGRLDLLAARQILQEEAMGAGQCERGLKLLYTNLCARNPLPPWSMDRVPEERLSMSPLQCVNAWKPGPDAPRTLFFWDMEVDRKGQVTGIDRDRHRLIRFDFQSGVTVVDFAEGFDFHSQTAVDEGYALLTLDGKSAVSLDADLNVVEVIPLHSAPGPHMRIRKTAGGFGLFSRGGREVIFLDGAFRRQSVVAMGCSDKVYDAFGYGNGLLFMDRKSENPGLCEIVWIGHTGEIAPVLCNLLMPFDIATWDKGILICDMQGIHFISLDGLAVVDQELLPWNSIAGSKGAFAHEAVVLGESLIVKFQHVPLLTPEFRQVQCAQYRLPEKATAKQY